MKCHNNNVFILYFVTSVTQLQRNHHGNPLYNMHMVTMTIPFVGMKSVEI